MRKEIETGNLRESGLKLLGHAIGLSGISQPRTGLQHPDPRCGEESHLRGELSRLLAAVSELVCEFLFEKDDRFADRHAVLCAAEAEHIDPDLPSDFLRRDSQRGDGVGEACSVHVDSQFVTTRDLEQRLQIVDRVNRAELRGLCEAQHFRLWIVNVATALHHVRHRLWLDAARFTGNDQQL